MKEGWEYKRFSEISLSISDGDWIEKKDQSDSGIRLIQTGNVGVGKFIPKDDSQKFITEETFKGLRCSEIFEGDVLISRLPSPLGRSCILPNLDIRCITAVDCSIVRLNKEVIIPEFFIYYTQSQGYFRKIDGESSGTTRARITRKKLEQTEIPLPSLSDQQSIISRLDTAFAQIDALKANAEKQLAEARALFQKALEEAMKPKEGWEEKRLRDVIDSLRTGLNPRVHFKLNTSDAKGYYITVRELKGFSFEVDNKTDRINEAAIKRINERSNLEIGDVLYSGTGTIGRTAIVRELPTWWGIKEGVYAITPKKAAIDSYFMVYTMHSDSFNRKVMSKTSGTTVRSIPMKELKEITIPVPTLDDQHCIVSHLDSLSAKVRQLEEVERKTIVECDALKQAMLREVFE